MALEDTTGFEHQQTDLVPEESPMKVWKKRSCIGIALALFPASAIGLPLALDSESEDSEIVALVAAEVENIDIESKDDDLAQVDVAAAEPAEPDAPTTLDEVEDTETSEAVTREFSANRVACLRLYNDPTADVAFQIPAEEVDSTTADQTTESSVEVETSTNSEEAPSTAAATSSTLSENSSSSTEQTTASTTLSTPSTEAPTSTAPVTQAPVTAPPVAPPAPPGWADAGNGVNVPIVLLAIRCCESRNNYLATNSKSTASGAYQFLDGTWAGAFGVKRAMWATPAQQDLQAIDEWERNGTRPWNASKHCWGQDV